MSDEPERPTKRAKRAAKQVTKRTPRNAIDLRWVDKNKRLVRVDALVGDGWSTHRIVRVIMEEFHVAQRTAYDDYHEAEARRAPLDALRAATQQQRAADAWERLQWIHELAGRGADANYARDKWCKVTGAYAPKKIEISGSVGVRMEMRAVMAILDETGRTALEVVMKQIEAGKARGALAAAVEPEKPPE